MRSSKRGHRSRRGDRAQKNWGKLRDDLKFTAPGSPSEKVSSRGVRSSRHPEKERSEKSAFKFPEYMSHADKSSDNLEMSEADVSRRTRARSSAVQLPAHIDPDNISPMERSPEPRSASKKVSFIIIEDKKSSRDKRQSRRSKRNSKRPDIIIEMPEMDDDEFAESGDEDGTSLMPILLGLGLLAVVLLAGCWFLLRNTDTPVGKLPKPVKKPRAKKPKTPKVEGSKKSETGKAGSDASEGSGLLDKAKRNPIATGLLGTAAAATALGGVFAYHRKKHEPKPTFTQKVTSIPGNVAGGVGNVAEALGTNSGYVWAGAAVGISAVGYMIYKLFPLEWLSKKLGLEGKWKVWREYRPLKWIWGKKAPTIGANDPPATPAAPGQPPQNRDAQRRERGRNDRNQPNRRPVNRGRQPQVPQRRNGT